ncbi:MAG: EamA family transporter [Patescibacteria group bacterium]|nr:EamA family transporter [Patescibacteria group bacterium]
MSWIFFAVLAPALYSASAYIDRFLVEKKVQDYLFLSILSGITALIAGTLIFVMRGFPLLSPGYAAIVLISGALIEVALVPYYHAIALEDASRVVPLFQVIPVFVLILSFFILHEIPTATEFAGFVLIICGTFALATESGESGSLKINRFFWYAMFSALLYAIPGVLFKFVLAYANFWDTLAYEFFGGVLGALALLWFRSASGSGNDGQIAHLSSDVWALLVSNELIYVAARFFTFYAIMLAPVFLVAAIGSSGPVFMLVYGIILSRWFPSVITEDIRPATLAKKAVTIAIIVAGAVLMS